MYTGVQRYIRCTIQVVCVCVYTHFKQTFFIIFFGHRIGVLGQCFPSDITFKERPKNQTDPRIFFLLFLPTTTAIFFYPETFSPTNPSNQVNEVLSLDIQCSIFECTRFIDWKFFLLHFQKKNQIDSETTGKIIMVRLRKMKETIFGSVNKILLVKWIHIKHDFYLWKFFEQRRNGFFSVLNWKFNQRWIKRFFGRGGEIYLKRKLFTVFKHPTGPFPDYVFW